MTPLVTRLVVLSAIAMMAGCGEVNSSPDAGSDADANHPPDASSSPCGARADFVETNDAQNDPFATTGSLAEITGNITAGGPSFTLGGCIDPQYATADNVDADRFHFTVAGNEAFPVRFQLTSSDAASLPNLGFYVVANGTPQATGQWIAAQAGGVVPYIALTPGPYEVWVFSTLPAGTPTPASAVSYTVEVLEYTNTCAPTGGPHYREVNDGSDSTDNDRVAISFATGFEATAIASPSIETTGLVVAAGAALEIFGTTALVSAHGDEYLDRDTYEIATGPTVTELFVRIRWPEEPGTNDSDMDYFLFGLPFVAPPQVAAAGITVSNSVEEAAFPVSPQTSYWLWVATYTDPAPVAAKEYSVDVCGYQSFP